jgi:hypothetical protein
MGKIDDMRRLREQQFADGQKRRTTPRAADVVVADSAAAPAAPAASKPAATKNAKASKSGAAVEEQGRCPGCGKMKPVSNGLLANHQKGFGKACTGSRKKPV